MTALNIIVPYVCINLLAFYNGFSTDPPSRAFLCRSDINKKCGVVDNEPQNIRGRKGFPVGGPIDGSIASGGNPLYSDIDEFGQNRWVKIDLNRFMKKINETHSYLDVSWKYANILDIESNQLFMTNSNFSENLPLKRDGLVQIFDGPVNKEIGMHVEFENSKIPSSGIFLAVWQSGDADNAFYQVIDFAYRKC